MNSKINFNFNSMLVAMVMALLFVGCSSDNNAKNEVPVIDIEEIFQNLETIKLSEYASSIDYYPLETSEKSLLDGSIISLNIVPTENGVVLFTPNSSNIPMAFDHHGKFISKIGDKGRTSKEFAQLWSIIPTADGVELEDYNKIMLFDNQYNFVKSFPIPFVFGNICKMERGNYVALFMDEFMEQYIKVFDKDGKETFSKSLSEAMGAPVVTGVQSNNNTEVMTFVAVTPNVKFFNVNGTPYIVNSEQKDTLFSITEAGELERRYAVNYGKYDEGVLLNKFIFETEKFIMSRFLFNAQQYPNIEQKYRFLSFIYDKSTGVARGMEVDEQSGQAVFKNDLDGGMPFFPVTVANGKMYQLVSAITFMDAAELSNSARMKEVAATLTEESNPVLVVATLK